MRTFPNLPAPPSLRVALLLFVLMGLGGAAKAGSFTWSSPQTSGSWSSVNAWTPAPGSGGPGVNDTANLIDTGGANRVVTYDSQASGTIGAVNFTQTSSGTNTLLLQGGDNNFVDLAPLVLGSSGRGYSELRMISNGLSITGSAPSLAINPGGVLTLSPGNTNANAVQFIGFMVAKDCLAAGGDAEASPWAVTAAPTRPPASFQCNPFGLEALGPSFGVARSGKTAAGIATSLAP